MSTSRARKRLAAITAAIPVLLTGSPLAAPAFASGEYAVTSVVSNGQVVGPNIGFLGQGIGHGGTTALFKIDPPAPEATISDVVVTLTNDNNQFTLSRDLTEGDGLAVYADVDGVANGFSARDRAEGLKSTGIDVLDTDAQGNVPLRIRLAAPVTGASAYYVTLRPNFNAVTGQKLRFEIRQGDVDGSAGDGPSSTVSTPGGDDRIVIDSARPGVPNRSSITVEERAPGTEDAYLVAPSVASSDTSLKIAFFNAAGETGASAILTRVGYDPTLPPEAQVDKLAFDRVINPETPTQPNRIPIGDGTGIIPGVTTVAKNNQRSNAVYARLVDSAGNLSAAAATLSDCALPSTTNTSCSSGGLPLNGNNVYAPEPATSVAFANASGAVSAINIRNEAGVPVRVSSPAAAGAARDNTNTNNSSEATKVLVRVAEVGPDGKPDLTRSTTLIEKNFVDGADPVVTDFTADTREKIREGKAVALAYHTDSAGNVSAPVNSSPITKDVTAPTVAVHLPSGRLAALAGELATVYFSEPMDMTSISTTPVVTGTGDTERCANEVAGSNDPTVSKVLEPKATDGSLRTWGVRNCFRWNADGSAATIRFGEDDPGTFGPTPAPLVCDNTAGNAVPDCVPRAGVDTRVYLKINNDGTPKLRDQAGNQAVGIGPVAGNSGYTPVIAPPAAPSAAVPPETRDLDKDGNLDAIDVEFTLPVDLNTFPAAQANLAVVGTETVPVTTAEYNGATNKVRFGFASTMGTGVEPLVRLTAPPGQPTGFKGTDGRDMSVFSTRAKDKASPRFKTIKTADTDDDGSIDKVIVTFSEPIDHTKDHNPDTGVPPGNGGYRVVGYENRGSTNNTVEWTANPSDTKIVNLAEKATVDTGATPEFRYVRSGPTTGTGTIYQLTDAAGNVTSEYFGTTPFSRLVSDGVGPRIMSRITGDADGDGRLDTIDVKFSEPIPNIRTNAAFAVAGYSIERRRTLGADGIRFTLAEQSTPGVGDTGVTPGVQYLDGMTDMAGNATKPDANAVTPVDGAGPAIMGACVASPNGSNGICPGFDPETNADRGAKLNVFFSEVVDTASVAATEFVVEQPLGTDKGGATAVAVAPSADTKFSIATLTFAADTLDYLADAYVRLGAAGAITDAATPTKNPSTQVSNVIAPAFPTVNMTITCPVAANPGFCSELTVNTAVTGSAGVTQWRLMETERGTTPADEEFLPTKPGDTYTFPAEGEYTLYLSGKDAFGRLSAELAREIWILKAPKILNQQFANSAQRGTNTWSRNDTLMDGDAILIGADAYGTDAAEWAQDGQPTDGGCLPQNLQADLRAITGKSTDGAVAPGSCDLQEDEQPFRQARWSTKAAGTTKYPVGTVLKVSSSDPGSMIVDGPNGTIARRQFISVNARRSWMITDASVITVPSALVAAIPRQSKNIGYRDGSILKSSTGYYYVENGVKRPVSTYRLGVWKISRTHAYAPTSTELRAMPTGKAIGGTNHADGTWIKFSDGKIYQVDRNGAGQLVRRRLASTSALRTLIPSTSRIYPANSSDGRLPIDSWLRGYRDGTMLRFGDGTYGVIARGSIRKFANAQTFNTLGFNASNALTANGLAVPRVSGQPYRVGTPIDRYALGQVVMKVTNIAGASVTAQVPNASGLFGVGTLDPVPVGWDPTR